MNDRLLLPSEIEAMASKAGLSVMGLCLRAGVAHTTFYRWRNGQSIPKIDVYQKIVTAAREALSEGCAA